MVKAKTELYVPDSNILIKLLLEEPDSDQARCFFSYCAKRNTHLLVPEIFIYEVANVSRRNGIKLSAGLELYEGLLAYNLNVISPSHVEWAQAEEISGFGTIKTGYPALYDSIYHAIAILMNGTFITADQKHFSKTQSFGSIQLLENWKAI